MADAVFSGSMTGKLFLDLREDVRFEIQTMLTGILFYALTTRVLYHDIIRVKVSFGNSTPYEGLNISNERVLITLSGALFSNSS